MNELNYSTNNSTKINIPHNDKGINIGGLEIKMAGALGDIIVAEYMKTITEEEKQLIFDYLHDIMFTKNHEDETEFKIRTEVKRSGYYGGTETIDTDLVKYIKKESHNVLCDLIKNKIDEIISSEEYTKHVDEIAEELVEYALEGYKADIKNTIRQNLVNNVLKQDPAYGGLPIRAIINEEMDKRIY